MRNDAVGGGAFRRRYLPFVSRGLDQHDPGGAAALADVLLRGSDAAAAAGRKFAPDPFASDVLARGRIFGGNFRPVAFELFGNELRKTRERTLTHFGARDPDHDGIIGLD